jgi:hypothetical protein
LHDRWEQLRPFNFSWVAATEGELIHHEDLEALIAEVAERGLAEEAVYALVDFEVVADSAEEPS